MPLDQQTKYEQQPESGKVKNIVFMLHGYGDCAKRFFRIANYFQRNIQNTLFVAIDAPQNCEGPEYARMWFRLNALDYTKFPQLLTESNRYLWNIIKEYKHQYNLEFTNVFLFGFSQGAMVSLYNGVYGEEKLGGIVAFAGGFVGHKAATFKPPILIIHGDKDTVVPIENAHQAIDELNKLNIQVDLAVQNNLDHSINDKGLDKTNNFINKFIS